MAGRVRTSNNQIILLGLQGIKLGYCMYSVYHQLRTLLELNCFVFFVCGLFHQQQLPRPSEVILKEWIQYIPRNMHTVLLCFALLWLCKRS